MARKMHDDEVLVTEHLVRRLLADQMADVADLPLTLVEPWGTDNAIWRLGAYHTVRLPRIHWATDQIERDASWLPRLAAALPVPIPEPVAIGEPGHGYPFRWAVHRWLPGIQATLHDQRDHDEFALALAGFVERLRANPIAGAPSARNRARPLVDYDEETRRAIASAGGLIDAAAATAVWEDALAAPPATETVWVHGDLEGNCLLVDGELGGVLDWGSTCVGDLAVDVQVVWSPLFTERSRQTFLEALAVDEATVARSRGAAINQACAALPYYLDTYPEIVARSWHKLAALGIPALG
ncbi:MAG: aminoglycoside phosphotransferase family protein [Acidimicrobiales bacterium]